MQALTIRKTANGYLVEPQGIFGRDSSGSFESIHVFETLTAALLHMDSHFEPKAAKPVEPLPTIFANGGPVAMPAPHIIGQHSSVSIVPCKAGADRVPTEKQQYEKTLDSVEAMIRAGAKKTEIKNADTGEVTKAAAMDMPQSAGFPTNPFSRGKK